MTPLRRKQYARQRLHDLKDFDWMLSNDRLSVIGGSDNVLYILKVWENLDRVK